MTNSNITLIKSINMIRKQLKLNNKNYSLDEQGVFYSYYSDDREHKKVKLCGYFQPYFIEQYSSNRVKIVCYIKNLNDEITSVDFYKSIFLKPVKLIEMLVDYNLYINDKKYIDDIKNTGSKLVSNLIVDYINSHEIIDDVE
jgi:hypothetical protein